VNEVREFSDDEDLY